MFTKMVLPRLGGSPSVWSVAMVFSRPCCSPLAYAHVLTATLRPDVHCHHLVVMALAHSRCRWPSGPAARRRPARPLAPWPVHDIDRAAFFALAQRPAAAAWFARTDHPDAGDPYFLYAASNVGSFLALLSYPTLVEPLIPLSAKRDSGRSPSTF